MNALIVEDEPMARHKLTNLLNANFPDINIIGATGSVKETVDWLRQHNGAKNQDGDPGLDTTAPDVILMDVELSDGNSFEIFKQVDVNAHVIMTTAYDTYALKAFEVNSIDYLLKPIEVEDMQRAITRVRNKMQTENDVNKTSAINKIVEAFEYMQKGDDISPKAPDSPYGNLKTYKERFLVWLNDRILPIDAVNIAYFYSESKNSYLVTNDGTQYVIDDSLDGIEEVMNPKRFFRISRSCIFSMDAIESVSKILGGRLRIIPKKPTAPGKFIPEEADFTVSRARVDTFIQWLEK